MSMANALAGALIGTAVGDSLGLPMEGIPAKRQNHLFPAPVRQRLIGGWGMISDDTEHTIMVAQALLECPEDPAAFQHRLARKLRWWFASLPAGVGLATARAILKLWLGAPPQRSGVYSAGNGPAMRSAVLGVYFAQDSHRRAEFVRASTRITHSDPRAEVAALAIAETAAWMAVGREDVDALFRTFERLSEDNEWQTLVAHVGSALSTQEPVSSLASKIGATRGVSGYAYQTAPIAIYAALRHSTGFELAITETLACGGDTDTVGAITGAIVGARVGVDQIPKAWRAHIVEWPRSLSLLQRIADRLAQQHREKSRPGPVSYFWPAIPLRNLAFLIIVLTHGFRRLFPPY
jgi:ADP-ribosyl-[dinitrogen reductase] hydrolase